MLPHLQSTLYLSLMEVKIISLTCFFCVDPRQDSGQVTVSNNEITLHRSTLANTSYHFLKSVFLVICISRLNLTLTLMPTLTEND